MYTFAFSRRDLYLYLYPVMDNGRENVLVTFDLYGNMERKNEVKRFGFCSFQQNTIFEHLTFITQ